jgi:hypothetical protein
MSCACVLVLEMSLTLSISKYNNMTYKMMTFHPFIYLITGNNWWILTDRFFSFPPQTFIILNDIWSASDNKTSIHKREYLLLYPELLIKNYDLIFISPRNGSCIPILFKDRVYRDSNYLNHSSFDQNCDGYGKYVSYFPLYEKILTTPKLLFNEKIDWWQE